jgi:hypothetical protein
MAEIPITGGKHHKTSLGKGEPRTSHDNLNGASAIGTGLGLVEFLHLEYSAQSKTIGA